MSKQQSCVYEYTPDSPSEFLAQTSGDKNILSEDGVWRCPHPQYKSSNNCIFHASDFVDPLAARKLLKKQLSRSSSDHPENHHRFIGSQLSELKLSHLVLDVSHNYSFDLRHSNIESLELESATINLPINLSGSTIGTLDGHNTTFRSRVICRGSTIENLTVESARFHKRVTFSGTTLSRANFFNAVFDERVVFSKCIFSGFSLFKDTDFNHTVNFSQSIWDGRAAFINTTFDKLADFSEVNIKGDFSITNSVFSSQFVIKPKLDENSKPLVIDLSGTVLREGELFSSTSHALSYDLTDATVGDIRLTCDSTLDLNQYKFVNTTFDGFEFSQYTESLINSNWYIHRTIDHSSYYHRIVESLPFINALYEKSPRQGVLADSDRTNAISQGTLRSTYLQAKNGATKVGDDAASAEFFLREMKFKRKLHFNKFKHQYSIKGLKDWIYNWLYNLLAGYGERPGRTFVVSLLIVLIFANIYALKSQSPYSISLIGNYIEFSFQAFVAFVIGPSPNAEFAGLAAIQAFIGAFMIALFVFTLTRSIHR